MDLSVQRKAYRNTTESVYLPTVGSNVSDAYFFHELSRTCGSDIAYIWIRAQFSARSKGNTATCTPNRSPMNSAPTTPRGRSTGMQFPPPHRSAQIEEEGSSNIKDSIQISVDSSADRYKAEYRLNDASTKSLDTANAVKSNGNNIGLLYTDAAHTVLDA
jgi:hypothetical protein